MSILPQMTTTFIFKTYVWGAWKLRLDVISEQTIMITL